MTVQRSAVPFLPCQEHQNALGEKGSKLAKFPNVFAKALATETTHHKGTAQPWEADALALGLVVVANGEQHFWPLLDGRV